jgi:hypothetical protein
MLYQKQKQTPWRLETVQMGTEQVPSLRQIAARPRHGSAFDEQAPQPFQAGSSNPEGAFEARRAAEANLPKPHA